MADNIIKVNVTASKPKSVTVSSSQVGTEITASSDTGKFWAQTAKNWAISDFIVDNTDYSSKYYANKAKGEANSAKGFAEASVNTYQNLQETSEETLNTLETKTQEAIDSIDTKSSEVIDEINNTKTTILNDIEFVADGEKEEIRDIIDTGKDELKEAIGDVKVLTTLKIGQIGIAPLGIDETLNMERYLNGQIIIQDQFKGFTNYLKRRVELYPSVACTEEEWQTEVTMSAFSQCGKFVIDDNEGTIRLPKVVNIQGLTDLSKLGEIVKAGLPNITAWHSEINHAYNWYNTGAFTGTFVQTTGGTSSGTDFGDRGYGTISFDASLSNAIYGNSDTVQQEQIQYPYFIQVATGAETEDNIINEIELNNPFSLFDVKWSDKLLNNISWLRSNGQFNSSIDYASAYNFLLTEYNSGTDTTDTVAGVTITFRRGGSTGIKITTDKNAYDLILANTGTAWYFVLDVVNTGFYLPQTNAFLQFGGTGDFVKAGLPNITGAITNMYGGGAFAGEGAFETTTGGNFARGSSSGGSFEGIANFSASLSNPIYGNSDTVQPNAVKGYLYFYVGETVQNANLINAGRIEEKLADCITRNDCRAYIVETYVNGTSGYNIYSNKWGEQWGETPKTNPDAHQTITFLKPFANTDYYFNRSCLINNSSGTSTGYFTGYFNKTATSVTIQSSTYTNKTSWFACGYIA